MAAGTQLLVPIAQGTGAARKQASREGPAIPRLTPLEEQALLQLGKDAQGLARRDAESSRPDGISAGMSSPLPEPGMQLGTAW